MPEVNVGAMIRLKNARHLLTNQQYRTLRGQINAGDAAGAMKGLQKLILLKGSNAVKNKKMNVSQETVKREERNR